MGGSKPRSLKLFYCYAHEDAEYRAGLNKHLVMLKHEKVIEQWYDGEILAGTEWDRTIKENLESADIVLLLVSADFLASIEPDLVNGKCFGFVTIVA